MMKLGLKDVAHKLYEYDDMISKTYLRRMKSIAMLIGVHVREEDLRLLRKELLPALSVIKTYKRVRNVAGGHYSPNVEEYISAVETLEIVEVSKASVAVHTFTGALTDFMKKMIERKTIEIQASNAAQSRVET